MKFVWFFPNRYFLLASLALIVGGAGRAFWPLPVADSAAKITSDANIMQLRPGRFSLPEKNPDAYAVIYEKPLFNIDRTPYSAPVGPAKQETVNTQSEGNAQSAASTPSFEVRGIIKTPDTSLALAMSSSGETLHLKVNDLVEGWRVSAIEKNVLLLEKGEEKKSLYLIAPSPGRETH